VRGRGLALALPAEPSSRSVPVRVHKAARLGQGGEDHAWLLQCQDLVAGWRWSSHPPVCVSPHFSASLQVTVVCWVEEMPASNEQSLSPQAEHAGIRTYFFSAENTEEQESWIQAMGEAARVQIPPTQRSAPTISPCHPAPLVSWRWSGGVLCCRRGPPGSVRVPWESRAGGPLAPQG